MEVKIFDKISTRYNYQNGGIAGFLEKEKEIRNQQLKKMSIGGKQQTWTKQAVNITNQLIKDNISKSS